MISLIFFDALPANHESPFCPLEVCRFRTEVKNQVLGRRESKDRHSIVRSVVLSTPDIVVAS
jgi:hypothetical protein